MNSTQQQKLFNYLMENTGKPFLESEMQEVENIINPMHELIHEFFQLYKQMRDTQIRYFKFRDKKDLTQSKRLEIQADQMFTKYAQSLNDNPNYNVGQPELF